MIFSFSNRAPPGLGAAKVLEIRDSRKPALLYMFEPASTKGVPPYSTSVFLSLLYTSQDERLSDFSTIFLSLFSIVT
jgi:hypothetical protein